MNRPIVPALLIAACILAGCGPRLVWYKPGGATQADFNRDTYECERDVRQGGYYGTGIAGALNAQGFGERCMFAKGWERGPSGMSQESQFTK